jgi:hypothetical protein
MFNYKVSISLLADLKIDDFLDYVVSNCKYKNTWLWNEEELIKIDNEKYNQFIFELREVINEKLSWGVLWEIQEKNEYFLLKKVVLIVGNYNVILFCQQWEKEKIVIVEDMYIQLKR